jgi:novel plant SNARE
MCHRLIKEYEREARVDGRPTEEIQAAKQRYVSQVNSYVARKKTAAADLKASIPQAYPSTSGQEQGQPQQQMQGVQQLLPTKHAQEQNPGSGQCSSVVTFRLASAEMTNGEIIQHGRQRMDDIDSELAKGKRIVMDTEATALKTAAELKKQTDQMGRVVNDLNEIEFSMQRASKVIRDITRGLATDKCALPHPGLFHVESAGISVLDIHSCAGVSCSFYSLSQQELSQQL